ncbi:MAG: TonB-dependent receptor [Cyclobacteriaceae bacterium]|nr:TonB-dependent receptor [Cyclobacteriaceae bacterium]
MQRSFCHPQILLAIIFFHSINCIAQQTTVNGRVVDQVTRQPVAGVNIIIDNTDLGTASDVNGNFSLSAPQAIPFTMIFSFVGMKTQKIIVTNPSTPLTVEMVEESILGEEVVVSASRAEENILGSPVSIEKINLVEIQQMSAPNFYDGLQNIKGVDMSVHSLIFKLPNTRGFNGNTNYRMNQFVDGVDNTAPGLSFAAGNIFGLSTLDVESVEMLVGASSALYGPGGMNGTLLMTSKNPFDFQGISATLQSGVMNVNAPNRDNFSSLMNDFNIRYAKAFTKKLALKITAGYIFAEDWNASDFRDRTDLNDPSLNRQSNPGYDGVNTYGDDIIVPVNLADVAPEVADNVARSQGYVPGSPEYDDIYNRVISVMPDQVISRTGFQERYLVDYGTKNFKAGATLHYKIHNDLDAIVQGNYSNGTSVYSAQNRFSLNNFSIYSGRLELKGKNFYIRSYGMIENSGNTYDAGATGLLINEAWKPSEDWYTDYIQYFTQTALLGGTEEDAHRFARLVADNRAENFGTIFNPLKPAIPIPGSVEFNNYKNEITSTPINNGGSKVTDHSKLFHIEGLYNFDKQIHFMEWIVGASHRIYIVDSEGTIFFDKPGDPIVVNQFGAFTQLGKKFLRDRVKLTASARFDKNENFKAQITPRFSFVYALNESGDRNLRGSWQTAFRFPAIADQWINLNTGRYIVLGGLPQVQHSYDFDTNPVYPLSGQNPIIDKPVLDNGPFIIPSFVPEKVTALEFGYRGLHLQKSVLIDAYVYQNIYSGFMAQQNLAQNPNTPDERRFQTTISTTNPVSSYGWSAGIDWFLRRGFLIKGNISFNALIDENENLPGYQSAFNTPDYRYNITVGNRQITKRMGFNVTWRWQNDFLWESSFGVGTIPAFGTLDANINFKFESIKSSIKIGGSNLLNKYYTTNLGSGQVGGLYYFTWSFDDVFK